MALAGAMLAGLLAIALAALAIEFAEFAMELAAFDMALAAELAAFAAAFIALTAALLAVLLAVVSPPQAIPRALSAKSVESAIIFFISKLILLSSSKLNLILVTSVGRQTLPQTSDFLGTLVNIVMNPKLVNPKSVENHRLTIKFEKQSLDAFRGAF